MSVDRYQTGLPAISPPWLRGPRGEAFLAGLGEQLDAEAIRIIEARDVRYPLLAPVDALPRLAWERRMERYPGEIEAAHRNRLARAHEVWRWAGTEPGVLTLAETAGFAYAAVWTLRNEDPARWAEVDVFLDGRPLQSGEGPALYRTFRAFMPAHARLRGLYLGVLEIWQDDGLWEDDGIYWGGGQLIPEA